MSKRNKILSVIYFIIGALFISYDVILLVLSPGTFLDNLKAFTHIWSVLGLIFIFCGVYRLKKGYSYWLDCKKWLKIIIVSLVSLGSIISIISLIFIFNPDVVSKNEKTSSPDYLIVLGGGIDKNGKLPENVMIRIEAAVEFLKDNPETICVVTGGKLDWLPFAEAPEMKNQLVLAGIDSGRVLVEDRAQDTIQNFRFSCELLANYENVKMSEILEKEIVVITSYFHLRRAERLANRMGFKKISGIGTPCTPITAIHIYVREIAAYLKLNLRILFTGQPTTLN